MPRSMNSTELVLVGAWTTIFLTAPLNRKFPKTKSIAASC